MSVIINDSFAALPFTRAATVITLRTISVCPSLAFQPLGSPPVGIALFSVVPYADGFDFHTQAHALRDDALPYTLINWLEERLPATGAVLTRERDHLLHTLRGASDPARHPRVTALVRDGAERLRVVPHAAMRHVEGLPAQGIPCLCRASEDCTLQLPSFFLPDPEETETGLIRVAQATWQRWAEQHAAWAEHDPARGALRALADRVSVSADA
ncbi:hypothetical protein U1707_00085 [Sphingomonas sp. PB2P12]|uniref:hypothetical protein n=1 Tax=Sphingomonas sandaracina TaxID=3096157 RepID=UPI002FC91707